jgi:hypothetical protein
VRRNAERRLLASERRKLADLDGVAIRGGFARRLVAAGEQKGNSDTDRSQKLSAPDFHNCSKGLHDDFCAPSRALSTG